MLKPSNHVWSVSQILNQFSTSKDFQQISGHTPDKAKVTKLCVLVSWMESLNTRLASLAEMCPTNTDIVYSYDSKDL